MRETLRPLEAPYSPEIENTFKSYPQSDGYILKLFRVFANSLRFLKGKGVTNLLDKSGPLSLREREIVILRVCANTDCEYEWGVHVAVFAQQASLSDEQVQATRLSAPTNSCWQPEERLLLTVVDELCEHATLLDDTYTQFQLNWDLEQQLEIFALCGNYHTVSFVANAARLDSEPFAARFPD